MPRCLRCQTELVGTTCPICKTSTAARADSGLTLNEITQVDMPAHVEMSESSATRPVSPPPKKRLVSTVGPSIPVQSFSNDSVPPSWMSRLQHAKVAAAHVQAGSKALPPPLKKKNSPTPAEPRPAHALIEQLEAEEEQRRLEEAKRLNQLIDGSAEKIVPSIAAPTPDLVPPPRRNPLLDRVLLVVLAAAVVGVVVGGYWVAHREPPPKLEVDPKLQIAAQKRKEAVVLLEKAHDVLLKGDAPRAVTLYQKILVIDPNLAAAERGLAIAYANTEQNDKAMLHYRRYLKLEPNAPDANDVSKILRAYEKTTEASKTTEAASKKSNSPRRKRK